MANETLRFVVTVDNTQAIQSIKKFDKTARTTATGLSSTWKKVGIAAAFTAATVAGTAFVKVTKQIVNIYSDFEKELTNVSTLVDTNTVSMEKLKKQILELPSTMGSATENTKALYQANNTRR